MRKFAREMVMLLFVIGVVVYLINCSNIEPSPEPGILRITLASDPSDTTIVIVTDTFTVGESDSFGVTIFQGKVYRDSAYAVLYPTTRSYKQEDITYNLIKRENNQYHAYIIFESYVPPQDYNRIKFGMKATVLKFSNFDEIKVEAPQDSSLFVELEKHFTVYENRVTEVNVMLQPFRSISRYKDTYQFSPIVQITGVQYH